MKNLLIVFSFLISLPMGMIAQPFVDLDFSGLSSYTLNNRPIGSTGVTFSMDRVVDVNSGIPSPMGFADGTLAFEGLCANCGPTIRLTFSQPVEFLISGKTSGSFWFGDDGLFTVSTPNGTLTLSDPNNELTGVTATSNQVTFNGLASCIGAGPTPCSNWTVTSPSLTSVDINFTASMLNSTGLRFRINSVLPPTTPVPTLSQWGLIILGLVILNLGGIALYRQRRMLAA